MTQAPRSDARPAGPDLSVRLGPLHLSHPVMNASGTLDLFEAADSLGEAVRTDLLARPPVGAYVPKTVTLEPRRGNPPPRVVETPAGMLNSIGLPNAGIEAFLERDLDRVLELPVPVVVNIGGFAPEEFALAAERLRWALESRFVDREVMLAKVGLELNVSCPNVHSGCMSIGSSPAETAETTSRVREVWPGLLVVKLTPNVAEMTPVARAAVSAGASALSLTNTYKGLVLDRATLTPYLGGVTGGLSGPAVKPLSLRFVFEVAAALGAAEGSREHPTEVPIIGMGGIATGQDVLEYLACGATAVAVGAAAFRDPMLYLRLAEELGRELDRRGLEVTELIGVAHRGGAG